MSLTYEPDRPALAARASVVEEMRALAQAVTQLPALDEYYAAGSRAALHHLERHLFEPDPRPIEPGDAVTLMEAGGERAEAELVAAEVLAALHEGVEPRRSSSSAARWRARRSCSSARSARYECRLRALAGFRSGTRRSAVRCWGWRGTRCCPALSARSMI